MKWSLEVGRVREVRIKIHVTFWIIVAWFAVSGWRDGGGLSGLAGEVLFVLALFGCIVLHELGHAVAAARYGIRTRDITLLPIGGVARLERMPREPRQELVVALAGPAVNVILAGVLATLSMTFHPEVLAGTAEGLVRGPLAVRLMVVNVALVVFNLLPAFPMDGGRVLRALLAMRMSYAAATQAAASVGQAAALLFAFLGLIAGNPFLLLIALFVWIGAAGEAEMVKLKDALSGVPVEDAMMTDFEILRTDDPLDRAVELILAGSQKEFPVLAGDRLVGILTPPAVISALAARRTATVREVMDSEVRTAGPSEMLESVLERFGPRADRAVPVLSEGLLVGLLTQENLTEMIQIRAAMGGDRLDLIRHRPIPPAAC